MKRLFLKSSGFSVLIATHQDASRNAKDIALAITKAIGELALSL